MIDTIAVAGYRSLRTLVLDLGRLTVVTGANGTGKSGLYRSLRLLAECALGGAVGALAREGGLASTLWAGPEQGNGRIGGPAQGTVRNSPVALRLGFAGHDDLGYAVDLGLPQEGGTAFTHDPEIKTEQIFSGPQARPAAVLAERRGPAVRVRDEDSGWAQVASLRPFDSMLAEVVDPSGAPEIVAMRERLRAWRFYDHLRTDAAAPARQVQIGTRTTALAHDGADLAACVNRPCILAEPPWPPPASSAAGRRSTRRSTSPFRGLRCLSPPTAVGSLWSSLARGCCVRWLPPSSLTARCATCSGWPHCSARVRRSWWC